MLPIATAPDEKLDALDVENWADYLTPEQRVKAVAEILATAALRILKDRHEKDAI